MSIGELWLRYMATINPHDIAKKNEEENLQRLTLRVLNLKKK